MKKLVDDADMLPMREVPENSPIQGGGNNDKDLDFDKYCSVDVMNYRSNRAFRTTRMSFKV